jgi:diaminopimelate decarboxylase
MNSALHSALAYFEQKDNELQIGGESISLFAEKNGTPLYIYNRKCIVEKNRTVAENFPTELKVHYAVKANPNKEIINLMAEYVTGFDVASGGELRSVMDAGCAPESVSFAGPGKSMSELKHAIELGIGSISIESEMELENIRSICRELKSKAKILIRVNPAFSPLQSGMVMGGVPSKFGIDSERVPAVLTSLVNDPYMVLKGIHIYNCCQNLSAEQLLNNFKNILDYAHELSMSTKQRFDTINLGGGLGIPYFYHEKDLDIEFLGKSLKKLLRDHFRFFKQTNLIVELGRYLVGESGIYLCKILDRKVSRNKVFLIIDGGMHQHLAASGNLGQGFVRRPFPMTIVNKMNAPLEQVTVTGPLCTPVDTFGSTHLPHAEPGDLLAVFQSGAYGLTASPVGFLSHDLPQEILF